MTGRLYRSCFKNLIAFLAGVGFDTVLSAGCGCCNNPFKFGMLKLIEYLFIKMLAAVGANKSVKALISACRLGYCFPLGFAVLFCRERLGFVMIFAECAIFYYLAAEFAVSIKLRFGIVSRFAVVIGAENLKLKRFLT